MLPVTYPDHFPDIKTLSGHVHDPSKPLRNARPETNWKPGDVAWVYDQKRQGVIAGVVTSVTTGCDFAFVRDVQPEPGLPTEIGCDLNELFRTSDELYEALFHVGDACAARTNDHDETAK